MVHLESILNLLSTGQTSVLHSYELSEILDSFQFSSTDRLVSFDVQALFTRVPVEETLTIVETCLQILRTEHEELLTNVTSMTNQAIGVSVMDNQRRDMEMSK